MLAPWSSPPQIHPSLLVSFYFPRGVTGWKGTGGVLIFLVMGPFLQPALLGVLGACLHKVDAGSYFVMNSMNTNPRLPLTLGSPKDQNQSI